MKSRRWHNDETRAWGHASVDALLSHWACDPCWQPSHGQATRLPEFGDGVHTQEKGIHDRKSRRCLNGLAYLLTIPDSRRLGLGSEIGRTKASLRIHIGWHSLMLMSHACIILRVNGTKRFNHRNGHGSRRGIGTQGIVIICYLRKTGIYRTRSSRYIVV
jgi:hypothetical protein